MKGILFVLAFAALSWPAHADPLPEAYLGKWCFLQSVEQIGRQQILSGSKGEECAYYIKISLNGYELSPGDDRCKFASIKHTGQKIRIVGSCVGEVGDWTDKRELSFVKGRFISKNLNRFEQE
jgi:hypothetical protein